MMDKRRTLRMQDEVIEEYSRPFPGEVVETYTRPLPTSMAPAKPQAAKKPKRRRWRGFLLLLVIAAGITAVIGGGQWVLGMLRGAYTGEYDYYDRDWQEDTTDSPITIPTVEAAADAELTLTAGRTRTLTAQEVYQTVKDAVVTVAVDLGGGKMSVGTGILFREDGYFVTNQHVVAGGSACTVLLADGTPYEANYIASDADYDVAVLKIDGTGFPTADFGNSDTLEVGETVYAIGTPLNLEMGGTFTDGIVSSVNREMQQTAGTSMPLIQTNAALNNGNSGGPLINSCGQVVGINFMKMYARASTVEGLGFAIPSVQVERVVNDLLTYGAVQPEPVLGLTVRQLPDQLADKLWGIRVESVTPGGAAERAGIQEGDYVLAADDRETLSSSDVLKARWQHHVGDTMTMTIWRDGEIFTVTLELKQAVQN